MRGPAAVKPAARRHGSSQGCPVVAVSTALAGLEAARSVMSQPARLDRAAAKVSRMKSSLVPWVAPGLA